MSRPGNRRGTGRHDDHAHTFNLPPCPECVAMEGDACRTPGGRAREPHKSRGQGQPTDRQLALWLCRAAGLAHADGMMSSEATQHLLSLADRVEAGAYSDPES